MRRAMIIIVAAASQLAASGDGCTPSPILDEGFDLWCGESLCVWTTVTAADTIRKAPTWHAKDAGVEFVGPEAIIEQVSPIDDRDGTCIQFDMIANVEATAEMSLEIDMLADGSIEHDERIPTSSWKEVTLLLKFAAPYTDVRFRLAKRGNGSATLAQIAATFVPAENCDGFEPIVGATTARAP